MLEGYWTYFASIQASLIFGFLGMIFLITKFHSQDTEGTRPQKAAGLVSFFAGFYTYMVLLGGQFFADYSISELIENGFGNDRVAFLFAMIIAEQAIRLIDLFYVPTST